jgi:hypothetical protein
VFRSEKFNDSFAVFIAANPPFPVPFPIGEAKYRDFHFAFRPSFFSVTPLSGAVPLGALTFLYFGCSVRDRAAFMLFSVFMFFVFWFPGPLLACSQTGQKTAHRTG